MRKFFILFILSVLFFSCSNVTEVVETKPEKVTIKEIVDLKESDISWTKALEEDRLSMDIYTDGSHVDLEIPITPEVAAVVYIDEPPVYPELKGFHSLDITNLSDSVKFNVDGFCENVSKNIYMSPENYFDSDYIFNYVLFRYDLVNSWKDRFGVDFPVKTPEEINKLAEEKAKKNKTEVEDEKKKITDRQKPIFDKWILGQPFEGDEIIQVPVRFCCQQGFVDVTLYISIEKNKIYQIVEEPYDGKK